MDENIMELTFCQHFCNSPNCNKITTAKSYIHAERMQYYLTRERDVNPLIMFFRTGPLFFCDRQCYINFITQEEDINGWFVTASPEYQPREKR